MKNILIGVLIVAAVALLAIPFLLLSQPDKDIGPVSLTILHTQEHHGQVEPASPFGSPQVGGVAYRSTVINQIRDDVGAERVLLFDSGDILIGTPLSTVYRGEPDILAYNVMGYEALILGNHEFDFEHDENRLETLADLADFPFLSSNVSGLTFAKKLVTQLWREIDGLNILILGITNPRTHEASSPSPDTKFADAISTVRKIVSKEKNRADLIIVVTHQGTSADVDLLMQVPEIDVLIGGHTIGFDGIVTRQTYENIDDVGDGVGDQPSSFILPNGVYVRAGGGPLQGRLGSSVGQLNLIVEDGKVVEAEALNHVVYPDTESNRENEDAPETLVAADPAVVAVIEPYIDNLSERLNETIGETNVHLNGERADVRSRETNLGNFIADVFRESLGTDIGLANGGGIRQSIEAGPISLGDLLSVQPFANTLVSFEITGAQLREAMENSVSEVSNGAGRFLQISGMTLVYDSSQPAGSRVVDINVGGEPLDEGRLYSVATTNFIGSGGDGFEVFEHAQNYVDTQDVDADILADYITHASPIGPSVEGRITDIATSE